MTAEPLQFGEWGELTERTIEQADLTPAEKERAYLMVEAQAAYLQILDTLSYPVDPEGHVHDLSALGMSKVAIAWTLALNGFRQTGPQYIKKRAINAPGCYADAHTWVDSRAPDNAADELRPEHSSHDPKLPPDTRRLAAIRDGVPPMERPAEWHTEVKIQYVDEERKRPNG